MGIILNYNTWSGEITRIYVVYDHPDPDWEHDPAIADYLRSMRGQNNEHAIAGVVYYTSDPERNYWVIAIARQT